MKYVAGLLPTWRLENETETECVAQYVVAQLNSSQHSNTKWMMSPEHSPDQIILQTNDLQGHFEQGC